MASKINFKNHIQSFNETSRSAQRILFVGTDYDLKQFPNLTKYPWKCIFTTNTSQEVADSFSLPDRQVRRISSKNEFDKATTKLDMKNPLLVFINGISSSVDNDDDIDLEIERLDNQDALRQAMASLLKSEIMAELVVIGYNPVYDNEIQPADLYRLFYTLSDNRITFYGVSEELEGNRYLKQMVERGIARVFRQNIGEELEAISSSFSCLYDDLTLPVISSNEDFRNTVYINNTPVLLNQNLCYDFNKYGRVLSVQEMSTGTITRAMQVDFFYQFLKKSPHSPQWYGYSSRNEFSVHRNYQTQLYEVVSKSLNENSETPIILAGQSGSGKSIALAALAFKVFQERKYPILFVNNPEVNFSAGSPAAVALDNILKDIRDNGGRALVILDWSIYNLRNDTIRRLSDRYNNRGQRVLFVSSVMYVDEDNHRYSVIKARIDLTDDEKRAFKNLMVNKGRLPRNRVERWMEDHQNDNELISILYTLIYELHPQLELGIKQEVSKSIADTKEALLELESPIPMKQGLTAIAEQLIKLGFSRPTESFSVKESEELRQLILNSLQSFSERVAVASLFKLRMPTTMAMRLLNIPECENRQRYRDIVFNAPWIVSAMDDDPFAPGEYYVEFRAPIDAQIYLNSIGKSKADLLRIVADIILSISGERDLFYNSEIRFLERLIRMVGPNSDDKRVKEGWFSTYGPGCPSIISALSELREKGIIEPQLVAQEITLIREYYGTESQPDLSKRIKWLEKAIKIAREVLDISSRPNVEIADWSPGLIDSITVESIFSELQLERCYHDRNSTTDCIYYDSTDAPILYSYSVRSSKLMEIIKNQPDNSFAYTALLSCFLARYEKEIYSDKIGTDTVDALSRAMSEVLEIVDITAASIPAVEYNEYYQKRKTEFLKAFDYATGSRKAEHYFNELIEKGSAVGVFIKATSMLRKSNIQFNKPLRKDAANTCKDVLMLLEDKRYNEVVSTHAACQNLRLQLSWLLFNKQPLFEHERQKTRLTNSEWSTILEICIDFKANIIDRQPECLYRAKVFYLMALAYAQLGDYCSANDIWRSVREDDFHTLGRQYTWHILCTESGEPKIFTGTFNYGGLPTEKRIYIKEMKMPVFYRSLQSIHKSDTSGDAPNLNIGTSYRGFSAFSAVSRRD